MAARFIKSASELFAAWTCGIKPAGDLQVKTETRATSHTGLSIGTSPVLKSDPRRIRFQVWASTGNSEDITLRPHKDVQNFRLILINGYVTTFALDWKENPDAVTWAWDMGTRNAGDALVILEEVLVGS